MPTGFSRHGGRRFGLDAHGVRERTASARGTAWLLIVGHVVVAACGGPSVSPHSGGAKVATASTAAAPAESAEASFERLMQTVAAGWNEGNARKAADCFTEDAVYVEPPDRQVYRGRAALFEFFGGERGPDRPMSMTWHHLAFNPATGIGFGEYTFRMNRQYHGIVVVQVHEGRIARWREYQYESPLDRDAFTAANPF